MFDRLSDRIATAVVTGLDVAVEFATLGEYRLAVEPGQQAEPIAPPRPLRGGRVFDGSTIFTTAPAGALPRPSTAVVREQPPATPPVMAICAASRTRSKVTRPSARPRPRARGGAITAPEQLCLWP